MSRYRQLMSEALQEIVSDNETFDEAMKWEVKISGLPTFYSDGKSRGQVRQALRKMLKRPDDIESIERTTPAELKKIRRGQIAGDEPGETNEEVEDAFDYIKQSDPDILFLQEIKTQDENFPIEEFKINGYYSYVYGQKSYNGVAILSKTEVKNINKNFIKDDLKQSRIITGEIKFKNKKIELVNIYVPNGNPVSAGCKVVTSNLTV